jgi:hypothetical protein
MTTKQKTRSQEVAEIIIQQMGGSGRLKAMINAKQFIHGQDENGICHVSFRHMQGGPRGKGINYTKITLAPSDTYTVEFGYIRSPNYIVRSTHSDIYCDMLQELWERETGLKLSLGTMGR